MLDSLQVLNLSANNVSAGGARAIAASPRLANLRHLNISNNPLGAGG